MFFTKAIRTVVITLTVAAPVFAAPAQAAELVTYTWTTTSEGFGFNLGEPSSASFQVPLSDVLSGKIFQSDITNIQLTYPGLTFDTALPSSIGLDAAAFVDPTTGAFIYHDIDQGLAVFAFAGTDVNSAITFLSITVDNRYGPFGNPLTSVADQFNAFNNGSPDAGFPTAGFWTASFPTISAAPEPAIWSMLLLGFGAIGWTLRSRRGVSAATA